jgi:hypothetical protein
VAALRERLDRLADTVDQMGKLVAALRRQHAGRHQPLDGDDLDELGPRSLEDAGLPDQRDLEPAVPVLATTTAAPHAAAGIPPASAAHVEEPVLPVPMPRRGEFWF